MPRLSQAVPKYRKHKASGQAVVTLCGRDHYLGPHGLETSLAEYDRLIAEYLANGRRRQIDEAITVNVLADLFSDHVESYYVKNGKPTCEQSEFKRVLRVAGELYGDAPAESFGPTALKTCRQRWIDTGLTRQTINKRQGRLVRMSRETDQ